MFNAGFKKIFLNEIDKHACATLRKNRPDWNVLEGDIKNIDFSDYKNKVDHINALLDDGINRLK